MSARRPWAWPLWPFYAAGSGIQDALYTHGILRGKELACPVISIGSISAGGAGKTPVVIALAKLLQAAGWQVDVLTRGYGRSGKGVQRVDAAATYAATRFGDEPVLIAQAAQVPVWVASKRYDAGIAAEQADPRARRLHLLDDGFQHRQLARRMDVAVVTAEDIADEFLPVGNLREAPSALHRADVLVVRTEEHNQLTPRLRSMGLRSKPLWIIERSLCFPQPLGVLGAGLRPMAFCALARPENFASMLREAGCGVVVTLAFRDHHAYAPRDITEITATAKKVGATGFVTTEKDAVKLTPGLRAELERHGPLAVVALEATFANEVEVLRNVEARLA